MPARAGRGACCSALTALPAGRLLCSPALYAPPPRLTLPLPHSPTPALHFLQVFYVNAPITSPWPPNEVRTYYLWSGYAGAVFSSMRSVIFRCGPHPLNQRARTLTRTLARTHARTTNYTTTHTPPPAAPRFARPGPATRASWWRGLRTRTRWIRGASWSSWSTWRPTTSPGCPHTALLCRSGRW